METPKKYDWATMLPQALRPQVSDEDYPDLRHHIDAAIAFTRLTYRFIYIIDFHRMNFLHVSSNPLFLCGETTEVILQEGFDFYPKHVPEDDLKMLIQINQAALNFFASREIEDRCNYTLSYNFHLFATDRRKQTLINHQITPLKLDAVGNLWLALGIVSLAPPRKASPAHILTGDGSKEWQYNAKGKSWEPVERIALCECERSVLLLANQGYTSQEIADKLNRSLDSVKKYRASILNKLGVGNITSAMAVAVLHRFLWTD